jgi:hypothetical protein
MTSRVDRYALDYGPGHYGFVDLCGFRLLCARKLAGGIMRDLSPSDARDSKEIANIVANGHIEVGSRYDGYEKLGQVIRIRRV